MTKGSKFERITNFIKKRNFIIAFSVLVLTTLTLRVSYASFLTVKTNTNNQSLTTGDLSVSYASGTEAIIKEVINAESDEEGMAQDASSVIYIQNTGNLDATFTLNIGYDVTNYQTRVNGEPTQLIPLDYVKVAVFEKGASINEERLLIGPVTITDLPIYRLDNNPDDTYLNTRYSLMIGRIGNTENGDAARTYKIKAWVDSDAPQSVSYNYFYLNTEIVAAVENAKMNYNISGTLKDTNGNALSGATIAFHNGSQKVITNSEGSYTFNNVYPGTYNMDITYNNMSYTGNLSVAEGNEVGIELLGRKFTGSNIYNLAAGYGTTMQKILKANDIEEQATSATFSSGILKPTYEVTGSSNVNLGVDIYLDLTRYNYYGDSGLFFLALEGEDYDDGYELNETYSYISSKQYETLTIEHDGYYKIQAWGASGGGAWTSAGGNGYCDGGKGSYTEGIIELSEDDNLYFYLGGQGLTASASGQRYLTGGYNGGGNSGNGGSDDSPGSGGGATDVRYFGNYTPTNDDLVWNSTKGLNSRIMVASGGGGGSCINNSSYTDISYRSGAGLSNASQTAAGWSYTCTLTEVNQTSVNFGYGASAANSETSHGAGGAGGGWYGGSYCNGSSHYSGGQGGTSYISGHTGSVAVTGISDSTAKESCTTGNSTRTCSISPSEYAFTETIMIDGTGYSWTNTKESTATMPNPNGGSFATGVGYTGNGVVKITYCGASVDTCE